MDNLEKNAWEGLAPLFCYSKVCYRGSEVRHFSEVLKEKEQRQYSVKRKKKKEKFQVDRRKKIQLHKTV